MSRRVTLFSTLFALLLTSAATQTSWAELRTDYCSQTFSTVCGDGASPQRDRDTRAATLRTRIQTEATAAARLETGLDPSTELGIMGTGLYWLSYMRHSRQAMLREATAIEIDSIHSNVARIKELLKRALDRQIRFGGWIGDLVNYRLKRKIEGVKILTLLDIEMLNLMRTASGVSISESYRRLCGPEGLTDQAFATTVEGKNYVVLCLGHLVGAIGAGSDSTSNFYNNLQVLAHEMAHFIDYGDYPELYGPYIGCLTDHYAMELPRPAGWTSTMTWMANHASTIDAHVRVTDRAVELTADYWATQTVLEYLREEGRSFSYEDKVRVLRESYAGYCSSPAGNDHPPGRFRVETLLGRDFGIQEIMQCSGLPLANLTPSCTLHGEVE